MRIALPQGMIDGVGCISERRRRYDRGRDHLAKLVTQPLFDLLLGQDESADGDETLPTR